MKIRDIGKPVTAKSLNESLAARFGKKLDLERFTLEQLEDSRNKLRTRLMAVETTESFDSVHNEIYQKTKMYLDILNAEISERGGYDLANESVDLKEASEDEAELVMASKTMVDKLTGWMEDVAEMQTETMLDLADSIREELGSEMSEQFVNTVKPGLEALYSTMEETRRSLTNGVGLLTGESTGEETLGSAEPGIDAGAADDLGAEPDMDAGDDDLADIDAELDADAEPADDLGGPRPRRESVDRNKIVNRVVNNIKKESTSPTKLATILSKKK
jgi:hypothetical protein